MFCPAGRGRVARGGASSAALGPPARATEQAGAAGGASLSPSLRSGSAFPPAALAARDPHAPAPSAWARWAGLATHPLTQLQSCGTSSPSPSLPASSRASDSGAGGSSIAPVPRVAIGSCARGSRTGEPRWGVAAAASCGPRGAPARIALSGRGPRSMRARARGRPGPHPATRGTGKQEASRSERRTPAEHGRPLGTRTLRRHRPSAPGAGSRPHLSHAAEVLLNVARLPARPPTRGRGCRSCAGGRHGSPCSVRAMISSCSAVERSQK